jgi:superfamily II DNA or RNA helicase
LGDVNSNFRCTAGGVAGHRLGSNQNCRRRSIAKEARLAELYARKDPRSSLLYARRSVEALLAWLYDADDSLTLPYKSDLNALMSEPTFKRLAGETIVSKFHLIRKVANSAIHTNAAITVQHSEQTFGNSSTSASGWRSATPGILPTARPPLLRSTGRIPQPDAEARAFRRLPRSPVLRTRRRNSPKNWPTRMRRWPRRSRTTSSCRPSSRRCVRRSPGRRKRTRSSRTATTTPKRNPGLHRPVPGRSRMGAGQGRGPRIRSPPHAHPRRPRHRNRVRGLRPVGIRRQATRRRRSQAVIQVTLRGAAAGQALRRRAGDGEGPAPGYLLQQRLRALDLGRRLRLSSPAGPGLPHPGPAPAHGGPPHHPETLATAAINTEIAGRSYQQAAIRAVTDALETDKERKALLVMATGSGKTRTVVALSSLLMQANWAKRVLFLADRVALVDQAARAFKTNLPGSSPVVLGRDVEADSRIHIATYPTMMNLINERTDDGTVLKQRFGIGHYDLIIIDEAHRSVYQKYRAIFEYFDAYLVGLTATPQSEVDRNTYSLFDIEDHVPTFAYELTQAISDGYLVPPRTVSIPLKFPVEGIRYEELSEEEKEEWDSAEWDEDGEIPDAVDPAILNTWLFNANTVDKALEVLMTRGHKVAGGDRLGKTIIFAKNQKHAEFIAERFNINYPQYGGTFAKIITHSVNYVSTLIDAFARTEDSPHIAVSVDMLDTGIDVPEVVNLLFFKVVRSKTKFWQMVGRGTRLRPELYGPGEDKQDFFIFDVCQNVEYFNAELPGSEGSLGQSLAHRSFAVRTQLLAEARTAGLDGDYVPALESGLVGQVAGLPRENFLVRPQLQWVEKFTKADSWAALGTQDLTDLQTKLAPLATLASAADTEEAKRFDLLMYQAQLAH